MASLRPARASSSTAPADAGGRVRATTTAAVAGVLGLAATAVLCWILAPDLPRTPASGPGLPPFDPPWTWIAVAWLSAPFVALLSLRAASREVEGASRAALVRERTAGVVRTRRLVIAAVSLALLSVLALSFGDYDRRLATLPAFALLCCIPLSVFVLLRVDDLDARQQDSWLSLRRARRDAERGVERRVGAPRFVRTVAGEPRASEVLHDRYRWSRRVERVLYVWLIVGFPLSLALFGPAGMFGYPGVALGLLALQDRLERDRSRGLRPPPTAAARQRARERMSRAGRWWSSSPPRALQRMRAAFVVLVAVGFAFAVAVPALRGDDPAERYRATVPFVIGFLLGLVALGIAEHEQVKRERAWLDRRRAERRSARETEHRRASSGAPLPR